MKTWLKFIALLIIAASSLALGLTGEGGFAHAWLALSLVAVFAASEARYWHSTKPWI